MIAPADIKKKALRHYKAFLTAIIKREHFFPLHIKGNKGKANLPMAQLFPALKRLLEGSKSKVGYGYTVTLKTVHTRHAGERTMPDQIYFENVEDYVKFIDKEQEFLAFRKVAMLSQKQVPSLVPWMQEHPLKVVKFLKEWESIVTLSKYFLTYPQPQQYARALPLNIPTAFVENHKNLLTNILNTILPTTAINEFTTVFEKRFGLLYEEPLIRIRALDDKVFPNWTMQDISLPISSWQQQPPKANTIFISTDLLNCLRFLPQVDSCIIFGNTATLSALPQLSWLADKQLYFWGDISSKGFQQLAQLRIVFPSMISFLMDRATFDRYRVIATTTAAIPSLSIAHLTAKEQELLLFLNSLEERNGVLQKHISQTDLQKNIIKS